jgi:hypothetical protein
MSAAEKVGCEWPTRPLSETDVVLENGPAQVSGCLGGHIMVRFGQCKRQLVWCWSRLRQSMELQRS